MLRAVESFDMNLFPKSGTVLLAVAAVLFSGAHNGVGSAILNGGGAFAPGIGPGPVPLRPNRAWERPAPPPRARLTARDCERSALQATLIKARYQARALGSPARIAASLDADDALGSRVKAVFGGSDLIASEYTEDGGCVVTARLPAELLSEMAGPARAR